MDKSLITFIWRHSKRDQIILVVVTLALLPLLYLTLELPKRIINDAIGAPTAEVEVLGVVVPQTTFLVLLCFAFLAAVLVHGLMKMRMNTMKGALAERLLRRFRYTLIGRILRFPRGYQNRISDGELVSMITAETEPLGGIMGDAIAHPLLQAGQMLTILLFLFLQSVWFGLAAVALIPLQAWLIPRMQRRINVLNRSRIQQVRVLAGDIGELSAGSMVLRNNSGWRYYLALTGARLGGLFETRLEIFRKKFFMKFINNFLTQVTPFFFYLVGGLLVISGQMSVGALVAALAAFKDLSSPWKELLGYYTRIVEMAQRYDLIKDRFSPSDLMNDYLEESPVLPDGDKTGASISLRDVSLFDDEGHMVLNKANLELSSGSWTCIAIDQDDDRSAFAQVLVRELQPGKGTIQIDETALSDLKQSELAAMVSHVGSSAYVFEGTVGTNVLLPAFAAPRATLSDEVRHEAIRSGNSTDASGGNWLPEGEALAIIDAHGLQLMKLVAGLGAHKVILSRILDVPMNEQRNGDLLPALIAMRPKVVEALAAKNLDFKGFDEARYDDGLTLPENLLFAQARESGWTRTEDRQPVLKLLTDLRLRDHVLAQSAALAATIVEAFGPESGSSPLFRQLGIPEKMLGRLHRLIDKRDGRAVIPSTLTGQDEETLMSLALNVPAGRFDRAFSEKLKEAVVAARTQAREKGADLLKRHFAPLDKSEWLAGSSLLNNIVFGRSEVSAKGKIEEVKAVVADVMMADLPMSDLARLVRDLPTTRSGANLSPQLNELISLNQAIIKNPSVVVLDHAMASHEDEVRRKAFKALRDHLPKATFIQLERMIPEVALHDQAMELRNGRVVAEGADMDMPDDQSADETSDLRRKLQAIRGAPLFSELNTRQLRMLAFSARWVEVPSGTYVFRQDDPPDGAYLIYEGAVSLIGRNGNGEETLVVNPEPGALIGELGLIRNDPRRLDMRADSETVLLRIQAEDFLSVVESDAHTAFKLIQVLIGYLDRPN